MVQLNYYCFITANSLINTTDYQVGVSDSFYPVQPMYGIGQGRLRVKFKKYDSSPTAASTEPNPQISLMQQPQLQLPVNPSLKPTKIDSPPATDPVKQIHEILTSLTVPDIEAALKRFKGNKEQAINYLMNLQISVATPQTTQQQKQTNQPELGNAFLSASVQTLYSPPRGGSIQLVSPIVAPVTKHERVLDPSLVYSGKGT